MQALIENQANDAAAISTSPKQALMLTTVSTEAALANELSSIQTPGVVAQDQAVNVKFTTAAIEAQSQQAAQTAGQLAYANLAKLRSAADKHLGTVIAQGRKAKLELVGKIYAEYFAVMSCNEASALVAKVEKQLKD